MSTPGTSAGGMPAAHHLNEWFPAGSTAASPAISFSYPLRRRRGHLRPFAEKRRLGTKRDRIAVYKRVAGHDPGAVDECTVRAPAILDSGAPAGNHDVGVHARNAGPVDPGVALRMAADDVLPFRQREDGVLPQQPPAHAAVG